MVLLDLNGIDTNQRKWFVSALQQYAAPSSLSRPGKVNVIGSFAYDLPMLQTLNALSCLTSDRSPRKEQLTVPWLGGKLN